MEDQFFRLGVALAIGLLVGLERGWREREQPAGSRTAGLRTFGIFGLLGGIFAALAVEMAAPLIFATGFLCVAVLLGVFQFHEARHDGNFSVTGVMAGLGVFGLGALAVTGDYRVAAAGGAALAAVLASREILHATLRRLSWVELRSALVLAVMTTIVLPILPNRTIDPWGGLNPWEIWFFTVLIATISYAGYIAVRVLGPTRGLLLSALAGAVASSTAVTVALARMAKSADQVRPLVGAATLAAMVSVLRVLIVIALLRREILPHVVVPALCVAGVLGAAGLAMLLRGTDAQQPDEMLRNPFELRALLVFALLFAVVSTASAALVGQFGGASLPATSAMSGMFDVDVAVLSALRLDTTAVGLPVIGLAILIALASNAFGRLSLAVLAGPVRFWLPLLASTLAAAAAGGVAYALLAAGQAGPLLPLPA
ncbi:MgtC/SapB family protein [Cypionkella sp.]|uniref:MgtC/SapB family protein n=1 Tax=Cypionkella sp. TaxID=2811411 RepID=UPI002AB94DE0|nr:MgtC/SapB family protein [Cypionkella sp.]MDZ4392615.1 MgtC/SapB family protein [Cypionkella sp.]